MEVIYVGNVLSSISGHSLSNIPVFMDNQPAIRMGHNMLGTPDMWNCDLYGMRWKRDLFDLFTYLLDL